MRSSLQRRHGGGLEDLGQRVEVGAVETEARRVLVLRELLGGVGVGDGKLLVKVL